MTHPHDDDDQGSVSAAMSTHPIAPDLLRGPQDDFGDKDAVFPFRRATRAPPGFGGTISSGFKTDILQMQSMTHQHDDDHGSNRPAIGNHPIAPGLPHGPNRHQPGHQHDEVDQNAMPPLEKEPPESDRTISPNSRTATLQVESTIDPEDDHQGSSSATIDNDLVAPGLQHGASQFQHDAVDNAMPPLEQPPPDPKIEEGLDLHYGFTREFCGVVYYLIRRQKTGWHHYCFKCNKRFRSWAGLNQHLEDSNRHNFCSDCEEDFRSPLALQTHLGSWVHRSFWTSTKLALGLAVLVLMLGVLATYCRGLIRLG